MYKLSFLGKLVFFDFVFIFRFQCQDYLNLTTFPRLVFLKILMNIIKKADALYWGILGLIVLGLFFFFSSGQFSFIFTLAGTVQTFGFLLIVIKIRRSRSVSGLSKETFINYTVIFGLRSIIFFFYKGYLPYDSSGDFIFKIQELIAVALAAYILYCITGPFKTSYNQDLDIIKCWYLMILAAVLAIFFHSNLNRSFIGDFGWAFTQYLETFAILSQFVLFSKKGGQIETYTSHFVAAQAISRILSIIFWIDTYAQLNTYRAQVSTSILHEYVGHWFMISQIIHLFIMGDFMYYWIKALRRGEGLHLPTYI